MWEAEGGGSVHAAGVDAFHLRLWVAHGAQVALTSSVAPGHSEKGL